MGLAGMAHQDNNSTQYKTFKVRGVVASGLRESRAFTEIPWVRRQFREKLDVDAYPGTLNVITLPEDRNIVSRIIDSAGVTIVPEEENFCSAQAFPVLINGRVGGAVVIPQVPDYPPDQLEIISATYIKEALSLKDGDPVELEFTL
ncbi:DUF120 domain-containing protein [Chloroflexota bacterium]